MNACPVVDRVAIQAYRTQASIGSYTLGNESLPGTLPAIHVVHHWEALDGVCSKDARKASSHTSLEANEIRRLHR